MFQKKVRQDMDDWLDETVEPGSTGKCAQEAARCS